MPPVGTRWKATLSTATDGFFWTTGGGDAETALAGKRCRRSLYLMNDILAKAQPEHKERIRQQLRVEYGADPLACKNAPVGGLKLGADAPSFDENMADIVRAMRAGNIDDNALQAEISASAERLQAKNVSPPPPVTPR